GKPKSLRLYCLRKYFWNNMRCDTSFRSYWFCHKSIDDHYITTTDIERHREEYLKGYEYLRIYEKPTFHLTPEQIKRIVEDYLQTEEGEMFLNKRILETMRRWMLGAEVIEEKRRAKKSKESS
ncbi:MAG: hypothetical protein ACP5PT_07405, partial [Brevinematia bacterium]